MSKLEGLIVSSTVTVVYPGKFESPDPASEQPPLVLLIKEAERLVAAVAGWS